MQKLLPACALVSLFTMLAAPAAHAQPGYAVIEHVRAPDGGFDYLSFDAVSRRLFVGREYGVMALDVAAGAVTGKLLEADDVSAVLILPGGNLMLSTAQGSNEAILFDRTTGVVKARIKAGKGPDAALYDPNSALALVMNADSQDATLIDVNRAVSLGSIALGGKPEAGVAGRGLVYINIEDRAQIAAVDMAARRVVKRLALEGCLEPTGLAFDAATDTLISACHNGVAKLLNARTGADLGSVAVGMHADGAIFDGGRRLAYVPCGDGTLTIFHLDEKAQARIIAVVTTQRGARTAALDPQTGRIYLAASRMDGGGKAIPGTFNVLVVAPSR